MLEHDYNKGGRILPPTEEPHAVIHKQNQFNVLKSNVEKNLSPRNPRLIPYLNNLYPRLNLPVSFSAKHSEEN